MIIAVVTSRTVSGRRPSAIARRESQSATGRMAPRLSDGWPHSAASQVSLKSSQRIIAPRLNAACTGSRSNEVPGTRAPPAIVAPGTTGPSNFVHAGNPSAWKLQARLSIRQ